MQNKLSVKIFGKDEDHEVKQKEILYYSVGIAGQNLMYKLLGTFGIYMILWVLPLSDSGRLLLGSLFSLTRVWDGVNDIIIGMIIDKFRFKSGEKLRPWIKIACPIIAVLVVLLFINPGLPETLTMVWFLSIFVVLDLVYTFQDIAQWGMTSVISENGKERERAVLFGRIFAIFGGLLPGALPLILGNADDIANGRAAVVLPVAAVIFGFGGMMLALFAAKTKERVLTPKQKGEKTGSLRLLLKNRTVMLITIASLAGRFTFKLEELIFFTYLFKGIDIFGIYVLNGPGLSVIAGAVTGLPALLFSPFTMWLSRKLGGHKYVLTLSLALNIVTRAIAFFIGYEGYLIFISLGVIMVGNILDNTRGIVTCAVLGDSMTEMEYKYGKRNEGITFATQNATEKLGGAIQTQMAFVSLAILRYDAKLGFNQDERFFKYAWLFYVFGPAVGKILEFIPLLFIKYNNKDRAFYEEQLALRKKQTTEEQAKADYPYTEEQTELALKYGVSPDHIARHKMFYAYLENREELDSYTGINSND